MNARQLHHLPVARTFLNTDKLKDFTPMLLRGKALSDDSCWDEFDSEYEESLPSNIRTCFDDVDFE